MHEDLRRYLPRWSAPVWAKTPSVSVGELRERFPALDPRQLSHGALADCVDRYGREARVTTVTFFDLRQLTFDCDHVDRLGWKGLYFVCPHSHVRTDTLYIVDGQLIARAAFRRPAILAQFKKASLGRRIEYLLRDGGRGLPRDVRLLLISELETTGLQGWPPAAEAIERTREEIARLAARQTALVGRDERRQARLRRERREAGQRKAKLQADEMGIWAALRRAEGQGRSEAQRAVQGLSLFAGDPNMRLVDCSALSALIGPPAPLREHLHVDVRVLGREKAYWRPGGFVSVALTEGVLIGVDLRSSDQPHMLFAFRIGQESWLQRVGLTLDPIGGRARPRFCCPVEGYVEVLALRAGRFASVKAQRLLRPSEVARRLASTPPKAQPPSGAREAGDEPSFSA